MKTLLAVLLMTPAFALAQTPDVPRGAPIHTYQGTGLLTVINGVGEADVSTGEAMLTPDGNLYVGTLSGGLEALNLTLVEGVDGRLYGAPSSLDALGAVFEVAFVPEAPANLIASATTTSGTLDGEVRLSWDPVRDANSYDVYRGTTSGSLTPWSPGTALTTTNVLVTGLTPGVRYYFAVVATNEAGMSARSAEASAIPTGLATPIGGVSLPDKKSGGGGSIGIGFLVLLLLVASARIPRRGVLVARR